MIKNFSLIRTFSSLKITVTCLALLFILVFWGTIDQVENGLYHAQEQFFHSFFLVFGWVPFPGAQLVLWILFINLVCVALTRFVYRWSHIGILIIHFGLLSYFVSAFVTLNVVEESHLTLKEGEASNASSAYHDWELSVWRQEGGKRQIIAYDAQNFKPGMVLDFSDYGFQLIVKDYWPNIHPESLQKIESNKEPEKNIPACGFLVKIKDQKELPLSLLGTQGQPIQIKIGKETYLFMLRHKRTPLPLTIKLIDFIKENHPNTDIARSYKSKVEIESNGLNRETVIFMNNPLRYKNYTFYQASYSVDAQGREYSTLAVVKNSGRLLPYIASLTTFAGLVTHFLTMAFGSRRFE